MTWRRISGRCRTYLGVGAMSMRAFSNLRLLRRSMAKLRIPFPVPSLRKLKHVSEPLPIKSRESFHNTGPSQILRLWSLRTHSVC